MVGQLFLRTTSFQAYPGLSSHLQNSDWSNVPATGENNCYEYHIFDTMTHSLQVIMTKSTLSVHHAPMSDCYKASI